MKALSVKQPYANLIASGKKTLEVRSWRTHYRGELLIVSSKRSDVAPDMEPKGCTVAIVTVADCRPMKKLDKRAACADYQPEAFVWVLTNPRRVKPVPVKGSLGIYYCDLEKEDLSFVRKLQ